MTKVSDVPGGAAARRAELLDAILEEEARLARLAAQNSDTRTRLATLQSELAAVAAEPKVHLLPEFVAEAVVPRTATEKVSLFRSLFQGRSDVFPTRFVSKKTGKAITRSRCATPLNGALMAILCWVVYPDEKLAFPESSRGLLRLRITLDSVAGRVGTRASSARRQQKTGASVRVSGDWVLDAGEPPYSPASSIQHPASSTYRIPPRNIPVLP